MAYPNDLSSSALDGERQTPAQLRAKAAALEKQARRQKPPVEFSKVILLTVAVLSIAVTVFTCWMVYITQDLTPLNYLISGVFVECGVGTGFYYAKAKVENRLKLLAAYKIKPTNADME